MKHHIYQHRNINGRREGSYEWMCDLRMMGEVLRTWREVADIRGCVAGYDMVLRDIHTYGTPLAVVQQHFEGT
eukprot:scaffold625349_cov98-Attheya_sp.AAC.1